MIALLLLTANLAAIGVLSFALFTRRRHRTELILLLLSVNVLAFVATTLLTVSSLAAGIEVIAALAMTLAGLLGLVHLQFTKLGTRDVLYASAAVVIGFAAGLTTVVPFAQLAAVLVTVAATGLLDWALAIATRSSRAKVDAQAEAEPASAVIAGATVPVPAFAGVAYAAATPASAGAAFATAAPASTGTTASAATPASDPIFDAPFDHAEPITLPLDFIPEPGPVRDFEPAAPKPRQKKPVVPVFLPPITAPEQVK
ncbi:DUF4956 domain-containing protein [Gulosibacter sp. ACHW.36C]|uniref:DUF4956 domain-containing protein n=1 Tax=Gulosibacter sediminis TaxID=1729695 RepID=A0ABY4MUM7_9MICO|nr:DUF4956 domain-containing protein [Gulosibacter sediminis]UQN14115.1 DUF4956 domain-containing protein [Gulosibacter sediminis]